MDLLIILSRHEFGGVRGVPYLFG